MNILYRGRQEKKSYYYLTSYNLLPCKLTLYARDIISYIYMLSVELWLLCNTYYYANLCTFYLVFIKLAKQKDPVLVAYFDPVLVAYFDQRTFVT